MTNMKNSKQIWVGIKEIISLKSRKKASKLLLDIDGHLVSDQNAIAESLNNFFAQIAGNIKSKFPHTNKSFRDFMGKKIKIIFYFLIFFSRLPLV